MKVLKIIGQIIKWLVIAGLLLFSLATLIGKSYGPTIIIWMIALFIIYWPAYFREKFGSLTSQIIRIIIIIVLLGINKTVFKSDTKISIYLSKAHQDELMDIYDQKQSLWPEDTKDIYINSEYGRVHLLTCGAEENPPLVMIHAASMGAHSWLENLEPLLDEYRIYSFDNIGEGNMSQLNDALVYPNSSKKIGDLYSALIDSLGIDSAPVFGASNGGYISMCLAYYHPEKVERLALLGPMGLTQLTGNSIMMMSLPSMYPFQFIRDYVTKWAIGEDEYVINKYGDWFSCIMKSTIPSIAMPVPMTTEQKREMTMPVLLFLGTNDPIVGDAKVAQQTALDYPNIEIEVLGSGHLIAVEKRNYVNQILKKFLDID